MAIHNYIGSWGEMMAQRYLLLRDYHIRDVDWHCGHCDSDIVAEKLGFIIFVEVKTRTSDDFAAPEDAVDRDKIRHLLATGNAYMGMYKLDMPCQFDVITIVGNEQSYRVHHIKQAFDAFNYHDTFEYKGRYGGPPAAESRQDWFITHNTSYQNE